MDLTEKGVKATILIYSQWNIGFRTWRLLHVLKASRKRGRLFNYEAIETIVCQRRLYPKGPLTPRYSTSLETIGYMRARVSFCGLARTEGQTDHQRDRQNPRHALKKNRDNGDIILLWRRLYLLTIIIVTLQLTLNIAIIIRQALIVEWIDRQEGRFLAYTKQISESIPCWTSK